MYIPGRLLRFSLSLIMALTSLTTVVAQASPSQSTTSTSKPPANRSVNGGTASSSVGSIADVEAALSVLQSTTDAVAQSLDPPNLVDALNQAMQGAKPWQSMTGTSETSEGAGSSGSTQTSGSTSTGTAQAGGATQTGGEPAPNISTSVYYIDKAGVLYKHNASGFTYVVGPPAPFMKSGTTYYVHKTDFYVVSGTTYQYVGTFENPFRTLDLRTATTMTPTDMTKYLTTNDPMSPLIPLVPVFFQAQKLYGVNAQYLLAHAIIESTWGSSQIAHDKNNLFGYSAFDSSPYASATTFPSKAYAILYEAWFVRKYYLDSTGSYYHGADLDGMNVDYATDPNWSENIAAVMWNMWPYRSQDYQGASLLPEASQPPIFAYPSGVTGRTTTSNLNVRTGPGLSFTAITQLMNGEKVTLTGWYPGWYRIALNSGSSTFVSSMYVQPQNLGVVTGDTVNLRTGPSTSQSIVSQLQFANELVILGAPSPLWKHVKTMDNVTGFVYGAYVTALN